MSWTRHAHWVVLGLMLVDAAPTSGLPGCRSSRPNTPSTIEVGPPDCSCTTESVQVSIDGILAGSVACGDERRLLVIVEAGTHSVSGTSGSASFPSQSVFVREGAAETVQLSCAAP